MLRRQAILSPLRATIGRFAAEEGLDLAIESGSEYLRDQAGLELVVTVMRQGVLYANGPFTHAEFATVFPSHVERWVINFQVLRTSYHHRDRPWFYLQVPGQYDWSVAQGIIVETDVPDKELIAEAADSALVRLREILLLIRTNRLESPEEALSKSGWADLPRRGDASNTYVHDPDHPGFLSERIENDGQRHLEFAGFELTVENSAWSILVDTERADRPPELVDAAVHLLADLTGCQTRLDETGLIIGDGVINPEGLLYALEEWTHEPDSRPVYAEPAADTQQHARTPAGSEDGVPAEVIEAEGIYVSTNSDGWSVSFADELAGWQDIIEDAVGFLREHVGGEVWQEDTEVIMGVGIINSQEVLAAMTRWWREQMDDL